jgi:hypothetical protein
MEGCANRRKKEEEGNLLLSTIIELTGGEDVFLGAGFS